MKIVLFVEGHTEYKVLPAFIKRWLDQKTGDRVGIKPVPFDGCPEYLKKVGKKTELHLQDEDVIAIFGLLDIYGFPGRFPKGYSLSKKIESARRTILEKVPREHHDRFHQHFAVHELEAWLLSDPVIFPPGIKLPSKCAHPEKVDFDMPPAKLLDILYTKAPGIRGGYKKLIDGDSLFKKLDPETVREKCPYFKEFIEDILRTVKL